MLTCCMRFAVWLYVYVCMHVRVIQLYNNCWAHVRCWLSRSRTTHWSTAVKIITLTAWQQPLLSSPLSKVWMFSLKGRWDSSPATYTRPQANQSANEVPYILYIQPLMFPTLNVHMHTYVGWNSMQEFQCQSYKKEKSYKINIQVQYGIHVT